MPITSGDALSPLEYQQHQMTKENDDDNDGGGSSSSEDINDGNSSGQKRQKLSRFSAKTTTVMGEGDLKTSSSEQSLLGGD